MIASAKVIRDCPVCTRSKEGRAESKVYMSEGVVCGDMSGRFIILEWKVRLFYEF